MRILKVVFNAVDIFRVLDRIEGRQILMSQEIDDFKAVVLGFLENIAADIQRLIDNSTSLSEEDKASLQSIAQKAAEVANIVPEP